MADLNIQSTPEQNFLHRGRRGGLKASRQGRSEPVSRADYLELARIEELKAELLEKDRHIRALEQSTRELEAFTYSVAHDLRSPLRAILGFSRILERDSADRLDSEGKENLRLICGGAKRMGQIIDALLCLSRCTSDQLARQPSDLAYIAKEVIGKLRANQWDRQVDFIVGDCPTVQGDPRLLQILLENLLGNAWKYTGRCTAARIEIGYQPDLAAYFVRDNGAGFDMAHAGNLFHPFQRLHGAAEFEGTGLGLSIVKRIVERHGGRVWAEARLGQGATIYFTLVS